MRRAAEWFFIGLTWAMLIVGVLAILILPGVAAAHGNYGAAMGVYGGLVIGGGFVFWAMRSRGLL